MCDRIAPGRLGVIEKHPNEECSVMSYGDVIDELVVEVLRCWKDLEVLGKTNRIQADMHSEMLGTIHRLQKEARRGGRNV